VPNRFGTFGGVFTPSILTILGAIMFMRAGFVTAQAGILFALVILAVAKGITFLTGLSISAISTNTRVRGGGSYFLISRTLGPEFGGAIGLAMYLAQALSVPFYVLAFVEAVTRTFPALAPHFLLISLATVSILFVLVFVGADWTIRVQFLILAVLGLAIAAFLAGSATHFSLETFRANLRPTSEVPELASFTGRYGFWVLFAIYFPAVCGIDAGLNMSGDLKDPARSLPRGTLAAIGVGLAVYAAQILLVGGAHVRDADLFAEPSRAYSRLVEQAVFGAGFVVVAGVFAATISSALGSFLGGPRILQALARDRIVGALRPFARGAKKGDEPRRAIALSLVLAVVVLVWAGGGEGGAALNLIAAVVTMFFLYAYGMVNLAAFVESFGANPSFRPSFRFFHWAPALAGAIGCAVVAFLISPVAAAGAVLVVAFFYWHVRRRVLTAAFGDARRGFLYARLRNHLLALAELPEHAKNWRPTVLAFSGNPDARATLVRYAVWLAAGRGIVSLAEVLVGDFEELAPRRAAEEERLRKFVRERDIPALPEVAVLPDFADSLGVFLQTHSLGPVKPNLVLFGWPGESEHADRLFAALRTARALDMSAVVLRGRELPPLGGAPRRIDVWWRGEENGSLMLVLAHLLTTNWAWARARIRVLRAVKEEAGREPAGRALRELVRAGRIEAEVEVVVSERPFAETLAEHSSDATVTFLGFKLPEDAGAEAAHVRLASMTDPLSAVLFVSSTGEADLLA